MSEVSVALINELNHLQAAYLIVSACTKLPYVECSEATANDQIFMFANQEDADAFCESKKERGIPVNVQTLKLLPIANDPNNRMVSQIRHVLSSLPALHVDVVNFKGAEMEQSQEIPVSNLVPAGIYQKVVRSNMYNPLLNLTGIFFCQAVRVPKESQDAQELQIAEEEFSANLVKSELLLAMLPPEGQQVTPGVPQQIQLSECRFPFAKNQKGETFLPLFTDIHELHKFAAGRSMGIIKVKYTQLNNYLHKDARGFLLNPSSFALPLIREGLAPMAARFGREMEAPAAAQQANQQVEVQSGQQTEAQ